MPFFRGKKRIAALVRVGLVALWALNATLASAAPEPRALQLEVFINDEKTDLIGSFTQLADGHLVSHRQELEELGIKVPGSGKPDDVIALDMAPGVVYRYDERTQTIHFTLGDDRREAHVYDLGAPTGEALPVTSGFGSVLNYGLFASQSLALDKGDLAFSGASATLDGRMFSPIGTFSQTGIIGVTTTKDFDALRLDTTFKHSDPASLLTFTAGDTISGGLPWTRPIRIGGVQVARNFGLRPDLVTIPLPSFSGSAAVPSTLDVYLNNLKMFSQNVGAGPFQLIDFPGLSGSSARVVLRDSAGRETTCDLPLYSSPALLRPGLADFSVEAGFPRLNFGTESGTYDPEAVASTSMRYGLSNWLTVEGHAEAGAGLLNAGIGAVVQNGPYGLFSLAASGSQHSSEHATDKGFQIFGAYETQLFGLSFEFSTQRTFGEYDDLASVTAPHADPISKLINSLETNPRVPKALDHVSVSMPIPYDRSNLSLAFINLQPETGLGSKIVSASWTRPLFGDSQMFVTGFHDFGAKRQSAIFVGISVPFGNGGSGSTGVTSGPEGTSVGTDFVKPMTQEVGSYGWHLHDSEGGGARSAEGAYRSPYGTIEAGMQQYKDSIGGFAEIDGGVATMGKDTFFGNRIDDAFAVVDAGAPGVEVLNENRPVGKANAQGLLLVPSLRSYEKNAISIDPQGLPVNAEVEKTRELVSPADRSGVLVHFGVKTNVNAAIVVVTDADGKMIPVGSKGRLNDGTESFIVGYDGRTYVKDLQAKNRIVVALGSNTCQAEFPFAPSSEDQVVIGPVACR